MKTEQKALVILSGGQDSITCLYLALATFSEVEAITFGYGQNHAVEIECAKHVCEKEKVPHIIVDISFLPKLVESALTSEGDVNKINAKGLPASFVPNRNALFLTLSHAYAQKVAADKLITGVCQTDYSGYPDCRNSFIINLEAVLNEGSDSKIEIGTPLMYMDKAQTFRLAEDLGKIDEVIEYSHTCYNGMRGRMNRHLWGYGCDNCPACEIRKKGYEKYLSK